MHMKKPTLDPNELENYRWVSNLPVLGKVIERVVAKTAPNIFRMADTKFLDPSQSGFWPWLVAPDRGAHAPAAGPPGSVSCVRYHQPCYRSEASGSFGRGRHGILVGVLIPA